MGQFENEPANETELCSNYSATLIDKDNQFYQLEIRQDRKAKKFWFSKKWGTIGGKTSYQTKMIPLEKCKKKFEKRFLQKTGNEFSRAKEFVKQPGKMFLHAFYNDFGERKNVQSHLPESVQKVVKELFNWKNIVERFAQLAIDKNKFPLGIVSEDHIRKACDVLKNLYEKKEAGNVADSQLTDYTNQFFMLIPMVKRMDFIKTVDQLNILYEYVCELYHMQVTLGLVDDAEVKDMPLVDRYYQKLMCKITLLDKETEAFQIIDEYVKTTNCHQNEFNISVDEIFNISREGEDKVFVKKENMHLLWHGTRCTNLVSILKKGLLISPSFAPNTGHMFGRGIYFSDVASKSARYCRSTENTSSFLLLCKVALGKIKEKDIAEKVITLPEGYDSLKGVGRRQPRPENIKQLDGASIPNGPVHRQPHATSASDIMNM